MLQAVPIGYCYQKNDCPLTHHKLYDLLEQNSALAEHL